jgi:hypothetical protein
LTLSDGRADRVREAFVQLRGDGERRMRLAVGARAAGDADFDPEKIRSRFFAVLRSATHSAALAAS